MFPTDIPTNFTIYKESIGMSPEQIIEHTNINVGNFIEKQVETANPHRTLLIVGRKARLLYKRHLDRLVYKGFSPAYVRRLKDTIWFDGNISKQVTILVDCINTGEEATFMVNTMREAECEVDKIYCYAADESGLLAIKKSTDVKVVVAHIINHKDSQKFFRRVQGYYQCLVDPLDGDHAHDVYTVGSYLTPRQVKRVFELNIQRIIGLKNLAFTDDPVNPCLCLPINGMENEILELGEIEINNTRLPPSTKDLLSLTPFIYPSFQLKMRFGEAATKFCIMPCFPIDELYDKPNEPPNDPLEGCKVVDAKKCYHKLVKTNRDYKDLWPLLCPLCIENVVERSILNEIRTSAERAFQRLGEVAIESHDPILRKL
jgi:hypothetical protein